LATLNLSEITPKFPTTAMRAVDDL
jgi:hypothetical protein